MSGNSNAFVMYVKSRLLADHNLIGFHMLLRFVLTCGSLSVTFGSTVATQLQLENGLRPPVDHTMGDEDVAGMVKTKPDETSVPQHEVEALVDGVSEDLGVDSRTARKDPTVIAPSVHDLHQGAPVAMEDLDSNRDRLDRTYDADNELGGQSEKGKGSRRGRKAGPAPAGHVVRKQVTAPVELPIDEIVHSASTDAGLDLGGTDDRVSVVADGDALGGGAVRPERQLSLGAIVAAKGAASRARERIAAGKLAAEKSPPIPKHATIVHDEVEELAALEAQTSRLKRVGNNVAKTWDYMRDAGIDALSAVVTVDLLADYADLVQQICYHLEKIDASSATVAGMIEATLLEINGKVVGSPPLLPEPAPSVEAL